MILVTGPTSNTGSVVVSRLREAGATYTCMSRRDEAISSLRDAGHDAVYGDYDHPDSLVPALRGAKKAFLVCTPDEHLERREKAFVRACLQEGVEHVVCISGFPVPQTESPILAAHEAVERLLESSPIDFTMVRPMGFMQSLYWMSVPTIQSDGVMVGAVGDGKNAHVDLRDVAEVIAKSLLDQGHEGMKYDLTGPRAVTMQEVAAILSKHLDQQIQYRDMPLEAFRAGLVQMGVPESSARHAAAIFGAVRDGRLSQVSTTLTDLGIEPRSWEDFATDLSAGTTRAATSYGR